MLETVFQNMGNSIVRDVTFAQIALIEKLPIFHLSLIQY